MTTVVDIAIAVIIATFLAVSALHARQVDASAEQLGLIEERDEEMDCG